MNRWGIVLCLGTLATAACMLNPHPLPPEEETATNPHPLPPGQRGGTSATADALDGGRSLATPSLMNDAGESSEAGALDPKDGGTVGDADPDAGTATNPGTTSKQK